MLSALRTGGGFAGAQAFGVLAGAAMKLLRDLLPLTFALAAALVATASEPFQFSAETKLRQQLVQTALGREPADMIVRGATMLNVFTLKWEPNVDIVIKGSRIAWVGPVGEWKGKCDNIIDARGEWAVPGFGESHKHIESTHVTPEYEAALVIPDGNTWTVDGTHEFGNVDGEHNVEFWLMARDAGSPFKHFVGLSSATPPTAYEFGGGYYGYREIVENMNKDLRVLGLDEVMDWPAVSEPSNPGYNRMWEVIQGTWDTRGVVEGHATGLDDWDTINGFSGAGLSSDHQVRFAQEGWDKMSRGIFLQLKPSGSIQAVIPYAVKQGLTDWSNIGITTDDRDALESVRQGTMDYNVRVTIEAGAPVEAAYAMASYYPARHWHIEHLVGSIAPGRAADIVLLKDDPKLVKIGRVICDGLLAAEDDKYLLDIPKVEYPDWARNTMKIGRKLTAEDFAIRAPAGAGDTVNAAVLELRSSNPNFITEKLAVKDGVVQRDMGRFISKGALVDRYHGKGVAKAFWRHFGPLTPDSALAVSYTHDLHNIGVFGSSDEAMALAVNTLAEQGGGWVLVNRGRVAAKVVYEIGGIMSQRPAEVLAKEMEALEDAGDEIEWMPPSPTSSFPQPPGLPRNIIGAFITATPRTWVLVAPSDEDPIGLINVATGERHPVVW
jgi:Adenine deaminase